MMEGLAIDVSLLAPARDVRAHCGGDESANRRTKRLVFLIE
jgi:hypothetical protein